MSAPLALARAFWVCLHQDSLLSKITSLSDITTKYLNNDLQAFLLPLTRSPDGSLFLLKDKKWFWVSIQTSEDIGGKQDIPLLDGSAAYLFITVKINGALETTVCSARSEIHSRLSCIKLPPVNLNNWHVVQSTTIHLNCSVENSEWPIQRLAAMSNLHFALWTMNAENHRLTAHTDDRICMNIACSIAWSEINIVWSFCESIRVKSSPKCSWASEKISLRTSLPITSKV